MVHDVQTIRDDLAFMRALAQEGRRAPLLIGHGLVSAGIVFSAASLLSWAVDTQVIAIPRWWQGAVYLVALALYIPYARWWRACASSRPGATSITNRAVRAAMQGMSYALLSLTFGSMALAYETHASVIFALIPCMVLAVYGAAWMVAAAMSEVRWVRSVAAACFGLAVLLGFTGNSSWDYLVFAASFLAVTALPGWVLMRSEPSLTV